ncbi:hypothetical protein BC940DRAFT_293809 [Gongronella butleri]|nr:hypothetical protein BC940DRAFT_293809 [Gongronella butleri]
MVRLLLVMLLLLRHWRRRGSGSLFHLVQTAGAIILIGILGLEALAAAVGGAIIGIGHLGLLFTIDASASTTHDATKRRGMTNIANGRSRRVAHGHAGFASRLSRVGGRGSSWWRWSIAVVGLLVIILTGRSIAR